MYYWAGALALALLIFTIPKSVIFTFSGKMTIAGIILPDIFETILIFTLSRITHLKVYEQVPLPRTIM